MAQIKNYITQDDGTTTVVIEGAELETKKHYYLITATKSNVICESKTHSK